MTPHQAKTAQVLVVTSERCSGNTEKFNFIAISYRLLITCHHVPELTYNNHASHQSIKSHREWRVALRLSPNYLHLSYYITNYICRYISGDCSRCFSFCTLLFRAIHHINDLLRGIMFDTDVTTDLTDLTDCHQGDCLSKFPFSVSKKSNLQINWIHPLSMSWDFIWTNRSTTVSKPNGREITQVLGWSKTMHPILAWHLAFALGVKRNEP